jgi:hypothetical protein
MKRMVSMLVIVLMFLVSFAAAQISLDVSGLKNEEYSVGEEITFKIILLDDKNFIERETEVILYDALKKTEISMIVKSGEDKSIKIDNKFPGGLWTIKAIYQENSVERTFLISENAEVEFIIQGDELIIKNTGNTRYTKTVQVKIGDKSNSYVQNIGVGDEKVLKLISPTGSYSIEITDGKSTIKRDNVQLHGTGNVVGAVDKNLIGYTGFAGANDLDPKNNERFISMDKLPLALIFIGGVFILIVLIIIERKLSKKQPSVSIKKLTKKSKK